MDGICQNTGSNDSLPTLRVDLPTREVRKVTVAPGPGQAHYHYC
jgi:hypothetical protein